MRRALPLLLIAAACACATASAGGGKRQVVLEDFAEGRVVQVGITDRLTGSKEMLFVALPKKSYFLEGYIQGIVTDYEDNPIQGVVVRSVAKGEKAFIDKAQAAFQSSSFDAGVSDSNGVYRIRFSLPIIKNKVDIQGRLLYNPGWEQECANLGQCYEPQLKESPFRLFFDMNRGMLVFSEGVRKVIVGSKKGKAAPARALPGAKAPKAAAPVKKDGDDVDLFQGFGFGN
jgi:hypothetical protein